jgi:hypothetical protein
VDFRSDLNRLRKKASSVAKWPNGVPQGLQPIGSIGFIGTTKVVPFQNDAFFRSL